MPCYDPYWDNFMCPPSFSSPQWCGPYVGAPQYKINTGFPSETIIVGAIPYGTGTTANTWVTTAISGIMGSTTVITTSISLGTAGATPGTITVNVNPLSVGTTCRPTKATATLSYNSPTAGIRYSTITNALTPNNPLSTFVFTLFGTGSTSEAYIPGTTVATVTIQYS